MLDIKCFPNQYVCVMTLNRQTQGQSLTVSVQAVTEDVLERHP